MQRKCNYYKYKITPEEMQNSHSDTEILKIRDTKET